MDDSATTSIRPEKYLTDDELCRSTEDLSEIDWQLNNQEEGLLKDILELEEEISSEGNLMQNILEATKTASLQYLDSISDVGIKNNVEQWDKTNFSEGFDRMKDSDQVKKWDSTEIKRNVGGDEQSRTMKEAWTSPFDKNVTPNFQRMSKKGATTFQKFVKAYEQRTKSVTNLTTENNSVNYKSNETINNESLCGLRSYRVGPTIPMEPIEAIKSKFDTKVANEGPMNQGDISNWLKKENFNKFQTAFANQFGLKDAKEAGQWIADHHLTIHEDPDGMYLVPTDVHDRVKHKGYRARISDLLTQESSVETIKQKMSKFITEERKAMIWHKTKTHGIRVAKGIGISAVKEVLKCTICVISEETYKEFTQDNPEKFIHRMMRIIHSTWQRVKTKCAHIIKTFFSTIKNSLLAEFLTLINDYITGIFKNIFRIVRQMWSSLRSAFKIIRNKNKDHSWQERIFEASKVLATGLTAILGFSLNELIDKGLSSIGIPFSPFIAECLSGLFAGILSSLVLMLFDNIKKKYKTNSATLQRSLLQSKILCIDVARIQIASLQLSYNMRDTYLFFGQTLLQMKEIRNDILTQTKQGMMLSSSIKNEINEQSNRNATLKALVTKYRENNEF